MLDRQLVAALAAADAGIESPEPSLSNVNST